MDTANEELDPIEKQMIRAGAFHPDDLMFNQAGYLSSRQKRWLMFEVFGWGAQIAIYLALILWAWVFYALQFQSGGMSLLCTGGLFWSVALGAGILVCYGNAQPIWVDINENEVKSIVGTISKRTILAYHASNCSLQIGEYQFSIHPAVYDSLINGKSYRVYYTPNLKRVVNIEPLFHLDSEDEQDKEQAT